MENSLTTLQHKKNFENCQKRHYENYVQWVVRAKTSLDYYLESREVKNLQDLIDLMLSDKMKDLLNNSIKSHILVKEGMKWLKAEELAKISISMLKHHIRQRVGIPRVMQ